VISVGGIEVVAEAISADLKARLPGQRKTQREKPAVLNAIESESQAVVGDFGLLGATERLGLHYRGWQRRVYAIRKAACVCWNPFLVRCGGAWTGFRTSAAG
jgi:hypothetical protein